MDLFDEMLLSIIYEIDNEMQLEIDQYSWIWNNFNV